MNQCAFFNLKREMLCYQWLGDVAIEYEIICVMRVNLQSLYSTAGS